MFSTNLDELTLLWSCFNCLDFRHILLSKYQALKVVSATFLLDFFLSLNESTCQTRKNDFYFTSKALFVLEKIKF